MNPDKSGKDSSGAKDPSGGKDSSGGKDCKGGKCGKDCESGKCGNDCAEGKCDKKCPCGECGKGGEGGSKEPKGLQQLFDLFAKSEDPSGGGLGSETVKKWFKEAGLDVKGDELDKAIEKFSKGKKSLDFAAFKDCVENLAKEKKKELKEWHEKLLAAGPPKGAK